MFSNDATLFYISSALFACILSPLMPRDVFYFSTGRGVHYIAANNAIMIPL